MPPTSAGILLYRHAHGVLQVLLAHPGGPFWRQRDAGAWTLPKGLVEPGESTQDAALRELAEELGYQASGELQSLGRIRQRNKWVEAFALEGDFDPATLRSNTFELEWPPRSGRLQAFPEIDRAQWFDLDQARERLLPSQVPLLDRLMARLASA